MNAEEFFAWQLGQDGLYELVDGVPVPHIKMMTGASTQHDQVTVNIIATLHQQLRGSGCRPTTDDITVECGERDIYESRAPRLVVEVLSPSASSVDRFRKLDEYRRHPTLRGILLVETRFPSVLLYRHVEDSWPAETYEALTDIIDLPEIGARLALSDIYDAVAFEPGRGPA